MAGGDGVQYLLARRAMPGRHDSRVTTRLAGASMHLTRLRYFIAIAEEQNVGRAARRLRVAQPALSRQLKALEDEVGVPLVERTARGVRLTAAGSAFLEHARRAVADVESGMREARASAAAGPGTTLRICPPDWPHRARRVAGAITSLRARHPDVAVMYDTTPWLVHAAALLAGELDVGFGVAMSPEDYGDRITAIRLVDEPASGALLPAGHPLAQRESLTLAELRDLPTLVPRATWCRCCTSRWWAPSAVAATSRACCPRRSASRPRRSTWSPARGGSSPSSRWARCRRPARRSCRSRTRR